MCSGSQPHPRDHQGKIARSYTFAISWSTSFKFPFFRHQKVVYNTRNGGSGPSPWRKIMLITAEKPRQREECEFLIRMVDEIPDERAPETVKEVITVHSCRLADLDQPCAYPTRYCEFKRELEEFANWARETVLRNT